MPTLTLVNMGSTPSSETVSATGNVYLLTTDDPATAIVFDLRSYIINPPDDRYAVTFKRIGDFEIPVLPPSRLKVRRRPPGPASHWKLETIKQVFVVNLIGQTPAKIGWQHLRQLFPSATISNIPLGHTDWHPVVEAGSEQRIIHSIEGTDLVERGEKLEVGAFTLFLFRNKEIGRPASVLVTGETNGRPFSFLFGNSMLGEFFFFDRVDVEAIGSHLLAAGRWYAFYPCHNSETLELSPVNELVCEPA